MFEQLNDDLKQAEPTTLSNRKVYTIDGILYRYLYKSDSIISPKFFFRPLPNQSKRCDLKLNSQHIYLKVQEVKSMYGQVNSDVVGDGAVQLSLFN